MDEEEIKSSEIISSKLERSFETGSVPAKLYMFNKQIPTDDQYRNQPPYRPRESKICKTLKALTQIQPLTPYRHIHTYTYVPSSVFDPVCWSPLLVVLSTGMDWLDVWTLSATGFRNREIDNVVDVCVWGVPDISDTCRPDELDRVCYFELIMVMS